MTYSPTWVNGTAGRVVAGEDTVSLTDAQELADAINRRRLIAYQFERDFSSHIYTDAPVRRSTIATETSPPFDAFRPALTNILNPLVGVLGGSPSTPSAMDWLWPEADADENKIIVSGAGGVGDGEVGLFQKLNGTTVWTDSTLTPHQTRIRAVHFNELRQAAEWIRRGRWEMPIYFAAGIFSPLPNTPWLTAAIANNGADELRALGYAVVRIVENPPRGPANFTARSSSRLEITADTDCSVGVYHCLRPVDFIENLPTWNSYGSGSWASPGGLGSGDSTYIGSIGLTAYIPGSLSGSALAGALTAMATGAAQNFLVRRSDTDTDTIVISGQLTIEFDLNSPPN